MCIIVEYSVLKNQKSILNIFIPLIYNQLQSNVVKV